ncbi:reticulophagy regulator 3 isoform X2 [Engraulis encrasicolus]|uniref:reticulophagy regulator 3 isoform X2 n=1 Tax=Engraulis encrasicolus TaxID=184585 RepID=UPI002FD24B46
MQERFFALSSLRLLFLLCVGLALTVCVDTWRNKIWPEIRVKRLDESESESWGVVQPGTLSVPELCQHMAELWVAGVSFSAGLVNLKRYSPGKFCMLTCGIFTLLAMVGRYIPGLVLSYSAVLSVLMCPLAVYHRLWQRVCVRLEPALQWLDFSPSGYMMSQPIDNQFLRRPIRGAASDDADDSEEELAAFCPTFDDAVVAKELALTDSEHSDAEISYTENGTFNLSRGQTPLTEGSEDLDRHSDPEESFACDLAEFPSINLDATLMEDDDDPSLGLPSLGSAGLSLHRGSTLLDLDSDQEAEELEGAQLCLSALQQAATSQLSSHISSQISGQLASTITTSLLQAALAGQTQPQPQPPAQARAQPQPHRRQAAQSKRGSRDHHHPAGQGQGQGQGGGHHSRSYRHQDSSELDTDLDGEDFEMLDQSELSQMDPLGLDGGRGGSAGNAGFLSNLLGKPQ